MSQKRIKVLYIGGYSRSGSTLLLRLLSRIEDFVGVGEIWDIWQRSFVENQLCGCGQPFRECEFWGAVVSSAFGGFEHVDVKAMQTLRDSVQSNRHIPLLTLPGIRTPAYQNQLNTYAGILDKLYFGIDQLTGGKIIIDSSKVASYAFVLRESANIDLHILHLVRDSRATAYSWKRKKLRPEIYWKKAYMNQYSPIRSASEWTIMNGLLHSLKRGGTPYIRVRYEDLVNNPREAIREVMRILSLDMPGDEIFDTERDVSLGVDHTVSGNPNRFQRGAVKIKPDYEWQEKMSGMDKITVTSLTWPLLLKYGYLTTHPMEGANTLPAVLPKQLPLGMVFGNQAQAACDEKTSLVNLARPRPLQILLVTARYLPYIGGTEIHTYELASRLVANGHDVTILTTDPEGSLPKKINLAGINVERVWSWPAKQDYYFAPRIYSYIMHGKWDVIHCQGYHTLVAPVVMFAARMAKIPYVVTFHSGGHSSWLRNAIRPLQQVLLRPLLARASALIAVSKWEAEFFQKRLHLPAERFTVIPNGSYLQKATTLSQVGQKGILIVSVGRLERYKGHHRVIAALPLLAKEIPDICLRIVGSGPYEDALRHLAHDLCVADRVDIQAVQGSDREGMASVLMGASLVILLSNYESQGIAVMEALSLGRPVLVADATALHELVASGLARATPLGSTSEEVARAILTQLRQPLIPENAKLPTWEACANKVIDLYRQMV